MIYSFIGAFIFQIWENVGQSGPSNK